MASAILSTSSRTGERQLTHSSSVGNHSPSYSPDGKKIAFLTDHEGRNIADPWNIMTERPPRLREGRPC
jgi:Tol biopolymer transport system component